MSQAAPNTIDNIEDDWLDLNTIEEQLKQDPTTLSISDTAISDTNQLTNACNLVKSLRLVNFAAKDNLEPFINKFGSIRKLCFTNCSLNKQHVNQLVELLQNNRKINSLEFEWTSDSEWDLIDEPQGDETIINTWISKLISSIHDYSSRIKVLRIEGRSIGDKQFKGLVTSIIGNDNLKLDSLLFPEVTVDKPAFDSLIEILKSKTSIRYICLPFCKMNDTVTARFVEQLLKAIDLPNSQLISIQAPFDFEYFSPQLNLLLNNRWKKRQNSC